MQPPSRTRARPKTSGPKRSTKIKRIHDRWISHYATHALTLLERLKSDLEG